MDYVLIIISAIFVNNIIFARFLGVCSFLGVSNKISTSLGMGGAVIFVMSLATLVTSLLQIYVLKPLDIEFLQTIMFILVIAALVQMVEIILKKAVPPLYRALGIFLPLITTNCAVLGIAILVVQKDMTIVQSVVFAAANAVGYTLAIVLFAGIRDHLEIVQVPKGMRGVPIAFVTAGILALAFFGFAGIVK